MIFKYLLNKNFVLGLGIGIIISALLMSTFSIKNISKLEIERRASELGMMYPDEIKAFFNNNR